MATGAVFSRGTYYVPRGKRRFDLVVAVLGLIVLAPVLAIVAVLVRMIHGSPVLFRQTRSGRGGRPFTVLKFRSMSMERDSSGSLLPESRRLTPFGRFLRVTSLDELPALINVVKGDMSLVGPRPLHPRYDAYYTERERRRFAVLPGITGWAQINGRNHLAWDHRLACDVWYVESCSFALDLGILLRTVGKVLRREDVQVDPGMMFQDLDEERRLRSAAGKG